MQLPMKTVKSFSISVTPSSSSFMKLWTAKSLIVSTMKKTKYAGTQTEKNLMAAFAGESEARNKYTYFASKAKKEGFEQIAALFLKTADNEKEHAKLWFKELNGIGDTAENLLSAAEGENYEWTVCTMALPKLPMRKVSMS